MSTPRAPSSPHGRRFRCSARRRTDEGRTHIPPCWQDGTERPLHRPTEPEDQQVYSSGQQKGDTIKTLRVIEETCHMCVLRAIYEGKANEKSLADLEGETLPHGSCLSQEMGFQGYTRDGMTIFPPKNTPLVGNSPPGESGPSCDRVHPNPYPTRETWWGRHNFRLQYRPWHYAT
jgi:hypothetical protein